MERDFGGKLKVLEQRRLTDSITLFGLAGSILECHGDAIVNAANTGGVTGFGVDELLNKAGGPAIK